VLVGWAHTGVSGEHGRRTALEKSVGEARETEKDASWRWEVGEELRERGEVPV